MYQLWEFVLLVVTRQEQVSWKVPSNESRELDGDVFAARHANYEANPDWEGEHACEVPDLFPGLKWY